MNEAAVASRFHALSLPLSPAQVRELRVGDMVSLSGAVTVSIGIPTHAWPKLPAVETLFQ